LRGEDVGGKEVWADSAYRSEDQEQSLKNSEHTSQINEVVKKPSHTPRHRDFEGGQPLPSSEIVAQPTHDTMPITRTVALLAKCVFIISWIR
jgi:hypothetical protein